MFRIYKYTNIITGKSYIGCTSAKSQASRAGKNGKKYIECCSAFGESILEDGWDNFKYEVLEDGLTKEEAEIKEKYWISKYNTIFPNGYNLESGGKHFVAHDITRQKHSVSHYGMNNGMYGTHRVGEANPFFGKTHTEKTRKQISDKIRGRHWYNDGITQIQSFECPEGFIPGMLRKSN